MAPAACNAPKTRSAVFTHAGHQNPDGIAAEFLGDGIEQDIRGGAVAVHTRLVDEDRDFAVFHLADFDVAIAGTNQHAAGEKQISGLRFFHFQRGRFVQALGEHLGEAFGHVLNHDDAARKILRHLRENILERVGAAGGNADRDDDRRAGGHGGAPRRLRFDGGDGDDHLRGTRSRRCFDFLRQFRGDLIEPA